MFDWIHGNKRIVQVILALLTLPFAFWGVESYQRYIRMTGDVASVGGQNITETEFGDALRQQQERMRQLLGRNFDPALLDSQAMRAELLEGMISQRLLMQYVSRSNLTVDSEQVSDVITSIPAFQENGRYSRTRAEALIRAENSTPDAFIASVRRDLVLQQVMGALGDSGIASKATAGQLARLRAQQREVAEYVIAAEPLVGEAKPSSEAIRTYYDNNLAQFQVPEQVSIEYLVLDSAALIALEPVSAEEVKKYYTDNAARFGEPEQRQASHILFAFKPNSGDQDKAKVRAKAEEALAQLRKAPGSFAEMARKSSDDPGSAAKGGDLGYFSRGMMVGPFEDAVFQLKPNQISDLVQSEFGFHIIKLTGVKPGKQKGLEEVRPEIEQDLKKQRAGRRYAESAEAFSNLVYEQADSLKPAADKFKLTMRKAEGITRQSAPVPALNQPRMLAALFTDDALRNHRNTETIEVASGTLVAARVVEHKPASQRPFEAVKADITKVLAQQEARALARKRGAERLEELKKGGTTAVAFGPVKLVTREKAQGLREEAVAGVFRADASKLPAYVGIETPNGYALYRVSRVIDAEPDEARQRFVQTELGRANGGHEFRSFLAGLRAGASVQVNKDLLEKKTN